MRAKPWDVSDGLWERLEPLLPRRERRFRYLAGSGSMTASRCRGLFVLHTGVGWSICRESSGSAAG